MGGWEGGPTGGDVCTHTADSLHCTVETNQHCKATIGGGLVAKSCRTLATHGLWPARLLCPWDSPGKNTGVGSHFLLQGIFPTQESNLGLLHCRQMIYRLSYEGSPKTPSPQKCLGSLRMSELKTSHHTSVSGCPPKR